MKIDKREIWLISDDKMLPDMSLIVTPGRFPLLMFPCEELRFLCQAITAYLPILASQEKPRPVIERILKSCQERLEHILARLGPQERTLIAFSQPELRVLAEALHNQHCRLSTGHSEQAGQAFKMYLQLNEAECRSHT